MLSQADLCYARRWRRILLAAALVGFAVLLYPAGLWGKVSCLLCGRKSPAFDSKNQFQQHMSDSHSDRLWRGDL
jgi:hypothetical protein